MNRFRFCLSSSASRVVTLALVLGLSACGGEKNQVVQICIDALGTRLNGAPFESDAKQFAAAIKEEGEGIVVIESTVLVEKGLSSEAKRGFMCRVQTDPSGKTAPQLILIQVGF